MRVMSTLSFSVSSRMLGWGKVAVFGLSRDRGIFRLLLLLGFGGKPAFRDMSSYTDSVTSDSSEVIAAVAVLGPYDH